MTLGFQKIIRHPNTLLDLLGTATHHALIGLLVASLAACSGGGEGSVVDNEDDGTGGGGVNSYIVTPLAGDNGIISPSEEQTVVHGEALAFTLTPNDNYIGQVDGSCGGSLVDNIYTTNAITADCTVQASFSLNTYTVTPSAGDNGIISPDTEQTLNHSETISFTLTPDSGHRIDQVDGCDGTLNGNTYTISPITADCTVHASFIALPAPQNLAATAGHQVNLAWAPVSVATEYCIYVSNSPGITLATVTSYNDEICTGNTNTLYTTTNLIHGTRYYFVVTARDGIGGVSAISTEISTMPVSDPLSDTGIDWCADGTTNILSCPQTSFPGQDGEYGRDADSSLVKVGGGHAGFDFTKLDANGNPLAAQGADYATTPWACVQDNHTGLMWEVKVDDNTSLHHKDHTFTWYNTDDTTNGGNAGSADGGTCNGTIAAGCDTEKFVAAINDPDSPGLCGYRDWRLPTRKELISLVNSSIPSPGPTIDLDYFPNIPSSWFWSSSPYADNSDNAWGVSFINGLEGAYSKLYADHVRLVRAGL